jgi:enoyl-CoA hydratase/carnithine racemase
MSEAALREEKDGLLIVTLNRPEKLNAMNEEMRAVIFGAVDDLRERDDLRALLIRAKGRYFSAGVDVAEEFAKAGEHKGGSMMRMRDYPRRSLHVFLDEMEAVEKPIVMAIHGPCLGFGLEMACSVDIRVAAESARFGLPELDLGFIPASGGVSRITRLCGIGWSKWMNVAGEQLDARTAMTAGLVQAVWPDAEFEQRTLEFCARLISRPVDVQGVAKLSVELAHELDRHSGRNLERLVNTPLAMRDNSALVKKLMARKGKPQ